jgi:hypothetical protein
VPFGGPPLTYTGLLKALQSRPDCRVTKQADGGIKGLLGVESGTLYCVIREVPSNPSPIPLMTFIEVFPPHPDVMVLDERLRIICRDLDLEEDELRRTATNP